MDHLSDAIAYRESNPDPRPTIASQITNFINVIANPGYIDEILRFFFFLEISFKLLKPQVTKIPSYMRRNLMSLYATSNMILPPSQYLFLVTIDMKSLYTTILQDEVINVCLEYNDLVGLLKNITINSSRERQENSSRERA